MRVSCLLVLLVVASGCSGMGPGGQGSGGGGGATGGGGAMGGGGATGGGGGGAGQASAGCGKALVRSAFGDSDGDGTPEAEVPLVVGGVTRRAAIRFPPGYDASTPAPVVFEFHGDQDRGFTTDPLTFTQGIFGADEYGGRAIVVSLRGENLLPPQVRSDFAAFVSWDTLSGAATNPDIAAVRAFRGLLEESACTARDKVFAVGFSGGGFFAQTLRCAGEPLAGIANFQSGLDFPAYPFLVDAAGAPLHLDLASCSAAPVPQLVVHFTADTTVVLQQGVDTANYWAQKHGCAPLASAKPSALDAACVEFDGCGPREDVVLCRPAGGGHEIWSPDGSRVLSAFLTRFF